MKKKVSYNKIFSEAKKEEQLEDQETKKTIIIEDNNSYDVTVSVKLLNHRKEPTLDSEVISQFEKGKKLTIIEDIDQVWGKTTDGGWVALKFCKRID